MRTAGHPKDQTWTRASRGEAELLVELEQEELVEKEVELSETHSP